MKYRFNACPSTPLHERIYSLIFDTPKKFMLSAYEIWIDRRSYHVHTHTYPFRIEMISARCTLGRYGCYIIPDLWQHQENRTSWIDLRCPTNKISNCSQDTLPASVERFRVYLLDRSRERKTGWPSRKMECHVERVQTVREFIRYSR